MPTQNFRPSLDIRPESETTRGKISGVKNLASWCGIADSMAIPKIPEYDSAKKKNRKVKKCISQVPGVLPTIRLSRLVSEPQYL